MVTLSFVADFTTKPMGLNPPEAGYEFSLEGDLCLPTTAEADYIFEQTPPLLVAIQDNAMPAAFKGTIKVKGADRAIVRSNHYTWHVKRADGQALNPVELSYAFASHAFSKLAHERQPTISMPLSTLRHLLEADEELSGAFVTALATADRESNKLVIDDPDVAARLEEMGLVAATGKPNQYLLLVVTVT